MRQRSNNSGRLATCLMLVSNLGCQSRRNWGPVSRAEGAKPRAAESRRNGGQQAGHPSNGWKSARSLIKLDLEWARRK